MTNVIGIDASRAFIKNRTGIEEYSYQVIKNLVNELNQHEVVLYLRRNQEVDFKLPASWKIKIIKWPYLWTQAGLSLELLFHPVDVLFVPAHTVPLIHVRNTIVVIHGLEYEFCPQAYSFWARFYMRSVIKNSCRWAKKIIAVSENTKQDLIKLYKVPAEKIKVIYEGVSKCHSGLDPESSQENKGNLLDSRFRGNDKFLLFIGRLEERKNIIGVIKAFEILKEQYKLPHKLILAGKYGYGAEKIEASIEDSNFRNDIILPGYISESEKWELLKNADVFLFPTFYEGFGIPILEAQSMGVPVVAGDNSSIREVVNIKCHSGLNPESSQENEDNLLDSRLCGNDNFCRSAILVDPNNAEMIADATHKLISDKNLRDDIIKRGYENVQRFSWKKCAGEIAEIL